MNDDNAENLTKHNSLKAVIVPALYVITNERGVSRNFSKHNSPRTVLDAVHLFGTDYVLNRRELRCVYFFFFFFFRSKMIRTKKVKKSCKKSL